MSKEELAQLAVLLEKFHNENGGDDVENMYQRVFDCGVEGSKNALEFYLLCDKIKKEPKP